MQAPAYQLDDIIAAAAVVRSRGAALNHRSLWRQLGARGDPMTAWKKLMAHEQQHGAGSRTTAPASEASEALKKAGAAHGQALTTYLECAINEAVRPHEMQNRYLETLLQEKLDYAMSLEDLISDMQQKIEALEEECDRLHMATANNDRPRLIL